MLKRRREEMKADDRRGRLVFLAIIGFFILAAGGILIKNHLASGPVDLNSASSEKLEALPGIGPETAKAIVKGRPYASVDDLDRVKGIGPATIEKLRERVAVTE